MTVRHCIVARNADNGICLGFSRDCTVEENLVHGNAVDGIVLGWYSSGNKVLRNCMHDQWSQSHPGGIQIFRAWNNVMGGGYRDPNGGYTSDYNFYLPGLGSSSVKDNFGQEAHSKMDRPKYRNAPAGAYLTDDKNFKNCTPRKLHLKGAAGGFEVGDLIEVNWDGRQRKVTEVGAGYIVFEPALAFVHPFGWDQVANWKKNADFAIDLRQTDDSPGRKAGKDGRDIGSNLDIQAYMKGDFNEDGKRDLPAAVKALEYEVHPTDE